jgi:hypothetical protein
METEYTKGFRAGQASEQERIIRTLIQELKNEEWSAHSIASLVGAIERE